MAEGWDAATVATDLLHGGGVQAAVRAWGIPVEAWLDLSTGINPVGWPVGEIPAHCWRRLPEADDPLPAAARRYYGCGSLLPVAGSQAAIQLLPRLRPPGRVGVPLAGYAEHAHRWQQAGHRLEALPSAAIESALARLDVLIVINPNNPTGERIAPATLLRWHRTLAQRGGWLVVDEAFMDCTPEQSLLPACPRPGLIVLRSLGKFFGLAGVRLGFVCAEPALLERLQGELGPWSIAGPSRWIGAQALRDEAWQCQTRQRLRQQSERLCRLLAPLGHAVGYTPLFYTLQHPQAERLYRQLAQAGILTRLFAERQWLRFGLPANETDWQRLHLAVQRLRD